jgi:superfamily II DNA or RNA helicase
MKIDNKKLDIQRNAYYAWLDTGERGIIEMATGVGKTWIFLKALLMRTNPGDKILFLAEKLGREKGLMTEIQQYNEFFGVNVLYGRELQFACYQSAYKWKHQHWTLVCADEVHEVGEKLKAFFDNNTMDKFMGLTATADNNTEYIIKARKYDKRAFLEKFIAPIVFTYTLNQAQEEGVSRKAKVYILEHEMFKVSKTIPISATYYVTEEESYNYWTKKINDIKEKADKDGRFLSKAERQSLSRLARIRASLLYKLPSKVELIKQVIKKLGGRTVLFMNSIETLQKITQYAVAAKIKNSKEIIKKFMDKEIDLIGSWKLIEQGENFPDVDNCIIGSYYSTDGPVVQRIGRLRSADSDGVIVMICTKDTVEEIWINEIIKSLSAYEIERITSLDEIKIPIPA